MKNYISNNNINLLQSNSRQLLRVVGGCFLSQTGKNRVVKLQYITRDVPLIVHRIEYNMR